MTAAAAPQHRAHLAEVLAGARLVVFDMDGTLYRQDLVRTHMARMLATHLLWSARGRRKIRIIRRFRQVREELADREEHGVLLKQYAIVSDELGVGVDEVREVTTEWLEERPLPVLARAAQPAVRELFGALAEAGTRIAVLSDYPAWDKLAALGLSADMVVSATEPEVDCFKPLPLGLERIITAASEPAERVLMIGDRDERDGECARRAGTRYLIKVKSAPRSPQEVRHFSELVAALGRT
jgi:FMN phosphatase YigB (HAD superfamily)